MFRRKSTDLCLALLVEGLVSSWPSSASAQTAPPALWLRLDPLPSEMQFTSRESIEGVPPRFVLMTDGSVYVGGRRELLRGFLDKAEMQEISTRLDLALKSLGTAGIPQTVSVGEGPPIFRFSALLGVPFQMVVTGSLEPRPGAPLLTSLPEFVRRLAGFRHPSLRPFDPPRFAMIVREMTLAGGCRTAGDLPPLAQSLAGEVVVSEAQTRGFPTGPDMAQVCEGSKRYAVIFRPFIPGER